jgi:hypothetical protein
MSNRKSVTLSAQKNAVSDRNNIKNYIHTLLVNNKLKRGLPSVEVPSILNN